MQTRIIALVAAAVLIIGGGAFLLHSRNQTSNKAAPSSSPKTSPQTNSGGQTIAQLFAMGGNRKCSFETTGSSGSKTDGIFYVSGTNVRGELKMDSNGKTQTTNILRLGDENYIWGGALTSGIKMKLSAQEFANNSQASQSINMNQKTNFNCSNWTADATMFVVPANVKFTDLGSIMAPSQSPGGSANPGTQSQCSICNSLSGNAKSSCLSAYRCQ